MPHPMTKPGLDEASARIHPGMPNHVRGEAELQVALAVGDADIEANRFVPFDDIDAELRQGLIRLPDAATDDLRHVEA